MKITMMIVVGIIGMKMIAHSCSYQARSLLVFVDCPFTRVVEEDDGGLCGSECFEDNDVEARELPVGSEILRCRKMSLW